MAIQYSLCDTLCITTFTKNENHPLLQSASEGTLALSESEPLLLEAADEIPFVFYAKEHRLFGAMVILKQDSLDEKLYRVMKTLIHDKGLNAQEIYCYLGPSLTFSHVEVDRNTLLSIIQKGYRAAAKRTNGVDYADLPLMNVVMLRKIGIPFHNIFIDGHDTYEMEPFLYSEKRGDEKKNPTFVELIQK